MVIRLRIHHWVLWWICLGFIFGAVALINVLIRDVPPRGDKVIAAISALTWLVGGVFCYAVEGVQIEEWHPAPHSRLPSERRL
jgi:hypothetical protein